MFQRVPFILFQLEVIETNNSNSTTSLRSNSSRNLIRKGNLVKRTESISRITPERTLSKKEFIFSGNIWNVNIRKRLQLCFISSFPILFLLGSASNVRK